MIRTSHPAQGSQQQHAQRHPDAAEPGRLALRPGYPHLERHLDRGVFTRNERRAILGMPPLPELDPIDPTDSTPGERWVPLIAYLLGIVMGIAIAQVWR